VLAELVFLVAFLVTSDFGTSSNMPLIGLGFAALALPVIIGLRRMEPRLARLRPVQGAEIVWCPLSNESFPARTATVKGDAVQLDADYGRSVADAEQSWRCVSCREENPGEFEACWSCGADRNRTGA